MANFAATIANRGYYKIPHVVKRIHDRDSIDGRFYEKHYTKVDSKHFDPIVEGMYRAVNVDGGSARMARIEGIDICGKTGTAQTGQFTPDGTERKNLWFAGFYPAEDPQYTIVVLQDGQTQAAVSSAAVFAQLCTALHWLG